MNIGDRVKIREDLEVGKRYGGESFTEDMEIHRGKQTIIVGRSGVNDGFRLEIDGPDSWNWTPEMLIPLPKEN